MKKEVKSEKERGGEREGQRDRGVGVHIHTNTYASVLMSNLRNTLQIKVLYKCMLIKSNHNIKT